MPGITVNSEPPEPTTFEDLGYVQVVRCKDCKYHDEEDGKNFCDCGNRPDDWFCADGERRTDDA